MAATESVFMKGANLHRLCELGCADGRKLVVEPYAIFTSPKGRRCYRCFVVEPAAEPGSSPWGSVEAATVTSAAMLEGTFQTRPAWDPFDKQLFPVVHFSVPTHDGRQRWADAPKPRDSATLKNFGGGF